MPLPPGRFHYLLFRRADAAAFHIYATLSILRRLLMFSLDFRFGDFLRQRLAAIS
jgi:hypothetical protein